MIPRSAKGGLPFFLVLACVLLAGCFHGRLRSGTREKGELVEAEGWTPLDPNKPLETRRRALAEAQKNAVEKVTGVAVTATTKVDLAVTSEQKISADVGGYIHKYEILWEKKDDGFLKIRIRAFVLRSMADGYDQVVAELSQALPDVGLRVAVLRFPYGDGRSSEGSRVVQEKLTARMAGRRGFQIFDQNSLDPGADRIVVGPNGLLESSSTADLAPIPDVDAVLTGRLVELPNKKVQIIARLIRIPDGLILAAAEGLVGRTWADSVGLSESASFGEWLDGLLSPPVTAFHRQETINKAIQDGMDSLRMTNGLSPEYKVPDAPRRRPRDPGQDNTALVRGRDIYERDCVHCHGIGGKGSPAMVAMFGLRPGTMDLTRKNLDAYSPDSLSVMLKDGKGAMPEYSKALSREDAHAILEYLRRLRDE